MSIWGQVCLIARGELAAIDISRSGAKRSKTRVPESSIERSTGAVSCAAQTPRERPHIRGSYHGVSVEVVTIVDACCAHCQGHDVEPEPVTRATLTTAPTPSPRTARTLCPPKENDMFADYTLRPATTQAIKVAGWINDHLATDRGVGIVDPGKIGQGRPRLTFMAKDSARHTGRVSVPSPGYRIRDTWDDDTASYTGQSRDWFDDMWQPVDNT